MATGRSEVAQKARFFPPRKPRNLAYVLPYLVFHGVSPSLDIAANALNAESVAIGSRPPIVAEISENSASATFDEPSFRKTHIRRVYNRSKIATNNQLFDAPSEHAYDSQEVVLVPR
jgi:hypothetical protein